MSAGGGNVTVNLGTAERVAAVLSTVNPRLLIGGSWLDAQSGRTFDTVDPATGRPLLAVAEADAADVDLAVAAARKAVESGPWATMSPADRGRVVWKIGDLIEQHADDLALLDTLDAGKPLAPTRAVDVAAAADLFHYMAGWATKLDGRQIPMSSRGEWHAYTIREPVGVVGQIIPWNFPLLMAAWKLAPALTCGNTIVLKPAEQTPLSALRLGALMAEAGLPAGVVNILPGFGETAGAAIAVHPGVDKCAFTGSTEVGRLIVQAAAGNLKKVSLELGGKSPNIILSDADLPSAIAGSARAIFFNMGECCNAGSRLYAQRGVYDAVVDGICAAARTIRLGPGVDPASEMGPLISQEQMERVLGYIDAGICDGARARVGGGRAFEEGYFVQPTVLVDTHEQMSVVREEIFGPVLVAQPFDDIDELTRVANDTPFGLAAGVWTSNLSAAHKLAKRLKAGNVYVNGYGAYDSAMPFGGFKQSGWGREMGPEVLDLYTEVKAVSIKL
jgi:phenylacetaldehyde dehydrogenase